MTGSILITGAGGQVGHELAGAASEHRLVALSRAQLDITSPASIDAALDEHQPDLVINAAAYTQVDRAESEREQAFAINRDGVRHLALACNARKLPLLHLSTDYVFSGDSNAGYREDDEIAPRSVYGESKAAGESALRSALQRHIILRTSWVFSATGSNFVRTMLRLGKERDALGIVDDQHGCPTSAQSIAAVLMQIAHRYLERDRIEWGTYHYCGKPETTWFGFARQIFALAPGFDNLELNGIATRDYPTPAARPMNSVLNCDKLEEHFGIPQADWIEDLRRVLAQLNA
jgi:dTDP-4-dehydrorhamnose reductase